MIIVAFSNLPSPPKLAGGPPSGRRHYSCDNKLENYQFHEPARLIYQTTSTTFRRSRGQYRAICRQYSQDQPISGSIPVRCPPQRVPHQSIWNALSMLGAPQLCVYPPSWVYEKSFAWYSRTCVPGPTRPSAQMSPRHHPDAFVFLRAGIADVTSTWDT